MTLILSLTFIFSIFSYSNQIENVIFSLIFKAYDFDESKKIISDVKKGIGGIQLLWGSYDMKDTQKLTSKIYSNASEYPPFIAIDYEGGSVYIHQTHGVLNIPSNMAIGKANDTKNTATLFYLAGLEMKKAGINMIFSPSIDVNTEPKNPIINVRAFSDDPERVSSIAEKVIDGLNASGIINTLKHFPGHGMVDRDSHLILPSTDIDPVTLYQIHIYPFKKIIEIKKSDVVMVSHILYKSLDERYPASLSDIIMKKILREQLKFDGIIITDSLDMKAITSKFSIEDAAVTALKNGADMILIGKYPSEKIVKRIKKALERQELSFEEIKLKSERIKRLKEKYNLKSFSFYKDEFDNAYKNIAKEIAYKSINLIKCENISFLKTASKIDILFLIPQRYLKEIINLYGSFKNINSSSTLYTDIKKIPTQKTENSALIVAGYFWPYINDQKLSEIIKIKNNYLYTVYINTLNPYDTPFLLNSFDCMLETYGINEFSTYAVSRKLTELVLSN